MRRSAFLLSFALAASWLAPAALRAQDPALKDTFQQGRDLWAKNGDRDGATAKLEQVVAALAPKAKGLDPDWRRELCQAYNLLAVLDDRSPATRAHAQERLQALLDTDPAYELDRDLTTTRLLNTYTQMRAARFGLVRFTFEPQGGILSVDGQETATASEQWLPLGVRQAAYRRPGYGHQDQTITVGAKPTAAAFHLDRVASTLRVFTNPSGTDLILDGKPAGTTNGTLAPADKAVADKAGVAPDQISAGFVIDGVAPGPHTLELRAPCHEPKKVEVAARFGDAKQDFDLEAFTLKTSAGTLALDSPAPGGELFLDGDRKGPLPQSLPICSGPHDLEVRFPSGAWSRHLEVKNGDKLVFAVKPLPRLAFLGLDPALGISGRDRLAAALAKLGTRLTAVAFLPPKEGELPEAAAARLKEMNGAELLLSVKAAGEGAGAPVALEVSALDGTSESLLIRPLEDDPLAALVDRLNALPPLEEPGCGLTLLDVEGQPGPFVLSADAASRAAGIQPLKALSAVDGQAMKSVAEFRARLAQAQGSLQVAQGGAPMNLSVKSQPLEIPLNSDRFCYPALLAALRLRALGAKGDDAGLTRLNLALALMHFRRYDQALEQLRAARLS
ncbi:MAG TPA: S1C family serine protease, partial [Holophagaceae bacterium]|nr:S1C family serine protease [Holophagaceae bacterium]